MQKYPLGYRSHMSKEWIHMQCTCSTKKTHISYGYDREMCDAAFKMKVVLHGLGNWNDNIYMDQRELNWMTWNIKRTKNGYSVI